jgi:hypothetical protein
MPRDRFDFDDIIGTFNVPTQRSPAKPGFLLHQNGTFTT